MESLFDKLEKYSSSDYYPFHMPGHKRRLTGDILNNITSVDITEIDGFDDLHDAKGILKEAQERAALICHAEETFFLVNGSTGGILSAISASVPEGGLLLMARNCHKAAYNAAVLRNLKTEYLYPRTDAQLQVCLGITETQVRESLEELRQAGRMPSAVFIVSPTYEGVISQIRNIAETVHAYGAILIVDEAHGAHLGIEGFPENSCQAGADLVIQSTHKTLPAMTQTALLHVNGERVDRARLRRYLSIYQSSSPSYVLMASIDRAMELVEKEGASQAATFLDRKNKMLLDLKNLKHLKILTQGKGIEKLDPCKLVVSAKNTNCTGTQLYDILREQYHLQMEMAAGTYVVAMLSIMDTDQGFDRLVQALREIDETLSEETSPEREFSFKKTAICYTMAEAMRKDRVDLALDKCEGRVSAEFVYSYPPGIPMIVPGEIYTKNILSVIQSAIQLGMNIKGLSDKGVWVTKENN